jgi:Cytochrome C oxidase, cbb3-type, subunit III
MRPRRIENRGQRPVARGGWRLVAGGQWIAALAALLLAGALSGCSGIQRDPPFQLWDDMKHQPKFKAQSEMDGTLFADQRVTRMAPADTVVRGHMHDDSPFFTGIENGMYVGKMPVTVTPELLKRGQTEFNINCSPCHDQAGTGHGIVPTRVPVWQPANLTDDRIVQFPDGEIFNVISNGRRTMPAYRFYIVDADRWAIISYVRALQRAAHSTIDDVPPEARASLK